MNTERDRFLTEAMGKCWHEPGKSSKIRPDGDSYCRNCRQLMPNYDSQHWNLAFSTWPGFGELKEWAETQEWWTDFITQNCEECPNDQWSYNSYWKFEKVNKPDPFANAVYEFLKEAK